MSYPGMGATPRAARARPTVLLRIALALAGLWPAPVLAQGPPAGVVTTVEGQATLTRAAQAQPVPVRFKDSVYALDRIATRQDSVVRVLLGGRALITVRELSVLTITDETGRAVVTLAQGGVHLGVARSRLRPGESVETPTPNAVAAVRGSALVDVSLLGTGPQTEFIALEASVPITVAPLHPLLDAGILWQMTTFQSNTSHLVRPTGSGLRRRTIVYTLPR